jgi:hypothetical protein
VNGTAPVRKMAVQGTIPDGGRAERIPVVPPKVFSSPERFRSYQRIGDRNSMYE